MVIRVKTESSALQLLQRYSSISPIPTPGNDIFNCNNCNTETPRVSVLIDLRVNALTNKHIQITNCIPPRSPSLYPSPLSLCGVFSYS